MDLTYDNRGLAETTKIYLAKPGKRLLGVLNGVEEDSVRLEINLQDTWELSFKVDRIVDGQYSNLYDVIDRHYELYMPNYGWFKIKEVPELESDGNIETLSVEAQSLEIELQQYDLFGFEVNTASKASLEYLATDNTYVEDDYTFFHDQVLFYRDTTQLENSIKEFADIGTSVEDLKEYVRYNHTPFTSWRISIDLDSQGLQQAIDEYTQEGNTQAAENLQSVLDDINNGVELTKADVISLCNLYPKLNDRIAINIDNQVKDEDGEVTATLTGAEILDLELQRQHELSLMWVLLHNHGWAVGYCDPYIDLSAPSDEQIPLANRVGKFEIDNQDTYSFLMQDVAQYYKCIFAFDTVNNLVNCFDINNVGFDTNIYLSFHNIMNNVTRSSDKELYTWFNVRGDEDFTITQVNFGESYIEDISYFLNTSHFSQEFIDKYNSWMRYREKKRPQYIQWSKDYLAVEREISDLYDRVPLDGADTKQYASFTNEELANELANYEAELVGYRKFWGVPDDDPEDSENWRRLKQSDDWANYVMIRDIIIPNINTEIYNRSLDTDKLNKEFNEDYLYNFDVYGNSYGVAELETQRKVLINKVTGYEKYKEPGNNQDEFYDQNHSLYIKYKEALASCEKVLAERTEQYESSIEKMNNIAKRMEDVRNDVLKTNPRFGFTEDELSLLDKYYIHTDYENDNIFVTDDLTDDQRVDKEVELMNTAYEELYAASHPQWQWETTQDNLLLMPEFKEWHGGVLDKMTHRELLHRMNMIIRNNPNVSFAEGDEATMYNTWRYTDLWVGNYIRVGVREDDHNKSTTVLLGDEDYIPLMDEKDVGLFATRITDENHAFQVKLRIIKIGLNPMLIEPTIDIEFSNMIQYKSKRNDFSELLDLANNHSKNQIKSTIRSQKTDNTFNVDSGLIMKIINNSTFGGYLSGLTSTVVSDSVNAVTSSLRSGSGISNIVGGIVADGIQAATINVDQITGNRAQFSTLFSNYIDSDYIVTRMLEADEATIGELTAEIIRVGHDGITEITNDAISTATINADQINVTNAFVEDVLTIGTDTITTIAEGTITTDKVVAALVDADEGQFDELTADSAFIEYLNSGLIKVGTVDAGTVIAALVDADRGDFDNLTADTAFIEYLNSGIIEARTVSADTVIAALVDAERGDFDNLTADSAFIQYLNSGVIESGIITTDTLIATMAQLTTAQVNSLTANDALIQRMQAVSSTTISQVVDQSYIHDLVAGHISVADLDAHTATADQIVLISSDGNPAIAFSNATQQFYDEDGNVRVQIGQDGNGDFNFIVRGADGTTALFNENGITQNGIPNSTIVNNMISDGTIQKGKLGFSIVEPNQQGGIDITQIYDGNGNLWGTEYTTFKQNTNKALEDLAQDIEDTANYDLYIETPNGTNIWGGNIQLNVKLLKNNVDVTDDYDASYFIWTRTSRDHDSDTYWNDQHSTGAKIITITANDVRMNADFQCKFEYENITVVSG